MNFIIILSIVDKGLNKTFLLFCGYEQKDASEPFDLPELLQELQKSQRQTLWTNLSKLLQDALVAYPTDRWNATEEEANEQDMELEGTSELVRNI